MLFKNSLSKMLLVMIALTLIVTWSLVAVTAKAGDPGAAKQSDRNAGASYMSDKHGSDPSSKDQSNYGSQPGVNRYLVMIPHSGTSGTCQNAMKEFTMNMENSSQMGSMDKSGSSASTGGKMNAEGPSAGKSMGTPHAGIWQWGCSTDDQTLYLFTSAPSEEAALSQIPSNLRSEAKVIALTNFTSSQMSQPGAMQQQKNTSSGSMKY